MGFADELAAVNIDRRGPRCTIANPMDPAERVARAFHNASRRRDPALPRWEGLAADLRRNRVADYEAMLADGWVFTPPDR